MADTVSPVLVTSRHPNPAWDSDPARLLIYRLNNAMFDEHVAIPPALGGGTVARTVAESTVALWIIRRDRRITTLRYRTRNHRRSLTELLRFLKEIV